MSLKKFLDHFQQDLYLSFPWECSFRIYKDTCFDVFKRSLTIINTSSDSTLLPLCIILKFHLSFGYQKNKTLICLFKFFGTAE